MNLKLIVAILVIAAGSKAERSDQGGRAKRHQNNQGRQGQDPDLLRYR